jgi:NitT/TauT family transport system ATP-binding protein
VHLDEYTANTLRNEIYSIVFNPASALKSVLLVSHNLHEVVQLADRVYVMKGIPASITEEMKIELPRPRPAEPDEDDPAFYQYVKRIYHSLELKEKTV